MNTCGVFYIAKYGVKLMVDKGKGGRIVNLASTASSGSRVGAKFGLAAYTMSKHAVVGLTKTMALEYAQHGVRVNAIAPARVETEMIAAFTAQLDEATKQTLSQDNPLEQFHGQMIQVAEIADIVAFLCSQK